MSNPQNQRQLNLDKKQQRLYDEYERLLPRVVNHWRRYLRVRADADEMEQNARVELVKVVQFAGSTLTVPLACHAMHQGCRAFLRGSATIKSGRHNEHSASEPRGENEGEEFTLGDLAADRLARRELQADHGDDHLAARLFELRNALNTLPGLTRDERRFIRLRFLMSLDFDVIAKRLHCSKATVFAHQHRAIAKLRQHFADRGALPPEDLLTKRARF